MVLGIDLGQNSWSPAGIGGQAIGIGGDPSDTLCYVEALILEQTEPRQLTHPDNYGTGDTVTYAFLDSTPGYYSSIHWARNSFRAFTDQREQVTRDALDMIESYSNFRFVETTTSKAEMTFGIADLPGYVGYAGSTFAFGSAQYKTLIHEIGHAIGMKNPHTGSPNLPAGEDSRRYTVMSYTKHPAMSGDAETHMLYDIATVQYLYGAKTGHASGNDVCGFADLSGDIMTIWDAGGHDVFDLSAASFGVDFDLRDGHYSMVASSVGNNVAIAFDTLIEDAFGGGCNDTLIGNAAANVLAGGAGNDILTGGAGSDTFDSDLGWGRDTVTDFTCHSDRLDLRDTGLVFADLVITSYGGGTTVAHGADQITLDAVDVVTAEDFRLALENADRGGLPASRSAPVAISRPVAAKGLRLPRAR